MSKSTIELNQGLYDYLLSVSLRESRVLKDLRKTTSLLPNARMQIAPDQGQFMAFLLKIIGAKNLIEVGTYTGYSTLVCAQALKEGKIIAIMQPHRFTRLRDLFDDFCKCFQDADIVFVTDVYAAGEDPIDCCNAESLVEGINKNGQCQAFHLGDPVSLASRIAEIVIPGDFIIFLGAGDITTLAHALPKELEHIFGVNQGDPITTENSNKGKISADLNLSQEIEGAATIQ